jgi:hypothetical protein
MIDVLEMYSEAQSLTGTAASTDHKDNLLARQFGIGTPLEWIVSTDVASDDTTGNETYVATFQTASDDAFTSPVTHATITITGGDAVNTVYRQTLPQDTTYLRYSRVYYTLGGTTPSVTLTSYVMPLGAVPARYEYASAYTVA